MEPIAAGQTIRRLRIKRKMTQSQLAANLCVSDKAISRWETGKGCPDISLIEPLAEALGVSVTELFSGSEAVNRNISCNLTRSMFYVCPVCGNILYSCGQASLSCCGILLKPLAAAPADEEHRIKLEPVQDETYLTIQHDMTKEHFISFIAWISGSGMQLIKLYPQGNAQTRIHLRGHGLLYSYCTRHHLHVQRL